MKILKSVIEAGKSIAKKVFDFTRSITRKANQMYIKIKCSKPIAHIRANEGVNGFSNEAILIIAGLIIGGVVIAGVLLLFKDTIFPAITEDVGDLFGQV